MQLKNVLIVVNDIERSKKFYKDIFGLEVILDNEGNVILTGRAGPFRMQLFGQEFIENLVIPHNNASELYFEENNIEEFAQKLDESPYDIEYVNRLMTHSWGQKVIRFYDPDGNLIEVGTP